MQKGQVQCGKGVFDHRRDLLREKRLLQWFLSMRMNVEECVNVHALCFERRTRVLEAKFLIYPHYGVWGCYRLVSELRVVMLGLNGPK